MLKPNLKSITIPAEVLGLSNIEVVEVVANKKSLDIVIKVKSTRNIIPCKDCGKPTKGHGLGRPIRLRHLPILGHETIIEITPRRGRCNDCDGRPTTTEQMDWYEPKSKLTKPYEQHLLFELVNSTIADVSRKENVDYHTVEELIDRYIETEVDYSQIESLGILGMDEISLKKGYRDFVTLISYRVNDKVHILGVVEGREKGEIIRFLKGIPRRLRKTIQAVCCDLYDGYMSASKTVFKDKVPIVADRFHVRKLYRKSLVQLRKAELARLKKSLTAAEYKKLKPAIAILRKHKDYFTEVEKPIVAMLFELSPKLKLAYQYSRELSGIFDSHITRDVAKEKLFSWVEMVTSSMLRCFDNL